MKKKPDRPPADRRATRGFRARPATVRAPQPGNRGRIAHSPWPPFPAAPRSDDETRRLLYNLQVHQIELEMQNEELRRIQGELEASRARYLELYDRAPVGYLSVSGTGLILRANRAAAEMLAQDGKSLVRRPFADFIFTDDRKLYHDHRQRLLDQREPQQFELRVAGDAGSLFWARIDMALTHDAELAADVLQVVLGDVSRQKRIEETQLFLIQSSRSDETFFASLARYLASNLGLDYVSVDRLLPDGLHARNLAVHLDGRLRDNATFPLADTPFGDLVGRFIHCVPGQVRNHFPNDPLLRRIGAESFAGTTLWDSQGRPIGLIAAIDRKPLPDPPLVTTTLKLAAVRAAGELERGEAEQALRERTAQAEYLNRELESFSYSVSHDLRTPLRAIEGYSRIIMRNAADRLDERTLGHFSLIRENVGRMGQMIDDLLALSRLGRAELAPVPLDMEALVGAVWEELMCGDTGRPVELRRDRLPPGIGDGRLIRQLVMNLLSNAVKFSRHRERPRIDVGGHVSAEGSVYHVRDNGAGFDMRYYDSLFSPFQRLHSAEAYEGTGVGLSIAQRIIDRHGGRIWAEAEIDRGACFFFTLPRPDPPAATPARRGPLNRRA